MFKIKKFFLQVKAEIPFACVCYFPLRQEQMRFWQMLDVVVEDCRIRYC